MQLPRAAPHYEDDVEGDPLVQVTVLDGYGDDEAAHEHHVGLLEVAQGGLVGAEDLHEGEEDHRYEGGDGERERLRHPVPAHEQHDVHAPQGRLVVVEEDGEQHQGEEDDEYGAPVYAREAHQETQRGGHLFEEVSHWNKRIIVIIVY